MQSCSPGTTAEKEKACTASRQGDEGGRGFRPMDGNKNPLDGDASMLDASASQAFSTIHDRWTVEKNSPADDPRSLCRLRKSRSPRCCRCCCFAASSSQDSSTH